ncbi:HugZ family protein [Ferrigenium sp. UT5]|uniref:HugZ family pyridoxamine 5'-phosphate oxidase n=1 Tax=Ferrigenium sp. UT5 TaxID=3242105 RepID=UPI00354B983C
MIPDKIPTQANPRSARQLLRSHRYGALGTLSKKFDGHPFASITPYLVDHDGSLLLLISGLAEHTRNILGDSRVSLVTHNQESPQIQTQGRVTVVGHAVFDPDRERCGKRYLRYFPEAEPYFSMPDFSFFRIVPHALRYIGGFGDIHWITGAEYDVRGYTPVADEDTLLNQINASRKTAQQGLLIGIDCDGYDVRRDEKLVRHNFPSSPHDLAEVRHFLSQHWGDPH